MRSYELLAEIAYWNGGVFAFRLGYMMNFVKKYIALNSFEDTRNRYSELPKISFDYEVAEKAESVAVVPFAGEWKDLGTWNTLTNELHKSVFGNAVMGAHCENTYVSNEFQNPIYVNGLKDVLVAACPDGILVCSKTHLEEIKKAGLLKDQFFNIFQRDYSVFILFKRIGKLICTIKTSTFFEKVVK